MKAKYLCSHCNHSLNIGDDIVLVAKNDMGEKGLAFLHADLGKYSCKMSEGFTYAENDAIKFSCPICHHNLTDLKNDQKANFILIDEKERKFDLVILNIKSENCTYKLDEQSISEKYDNQWMFYQSPEWFQFF